MKPKTDDQGAFEELKHGVFALRDSLRLKSHLAGMDARIWWEEELRPQLTTLETDLTQALRQASGEARLKSHLGAMELRLGWSRLEPRLLDFANRLGDGRRLRELTRGIRERFGPAEHSRAR